MKLNQFINLDTIRKRYARVDVYDVRKELDYQARRNSASMAVRRVANLGSQVIENSADQLSGVITDTVGNTLQFVFGPQIASNLGLFAGTLGKGVIGVAWMGLAASVSASFTQMDFIHQKSNLKDLYADELAAKLHKPAKSVTVADMEALSRENAVLNEELTRARKQRNFAIPLAIVATLASFAVVMVALPVVLPGLATLPWWGGLMVKGTVSAMTYMAVKTPLQVIGDALLGLTDETKNDRIVELAHAHAKGVTVTAEDVAPVVGKIHPSHQMLENLARNINRGTIKPTELLFASEGELVPRQMVQDEPASNSTFFQDKVGIKRDPGLSFAEQVSRQGARDISLDIL